MPIAGGKTVDARLWNIGMKVKDVQAEVDYFVELGPSARSRAADDTRR
jgi:hypothetical protein